ncbi:MAG TPA: hypothetical protein VF795_11030 [Desulfuromonadaceae bacterium]
MSRLLRMTYGRSGSRLDGILVTIPRGEPAADPRWLTLAVLAVWIAVPVLVCRLALPTATSRQTVIDTSRLEVRLPAEAERPVIPPPPRPAPVERPAEPPKKADAPQPVAPRQETPVERAEPVKRPAEAAPPAEQRRPVITRQAAPQRADGEGYQPRTLVRERARVAVEAAPPAEARIRREAAVRSAPAGGMAITRTRGAVAADLPMVGGRVVPQRQRFAMADTPSPGGGGTPRTFTRGGHAVTEAQGSASPRPALARERVQSAGAGDGGGGTASTVGLVRGISLASLDICASPGEEENHITAVLSVIGTRRSCTDGTGEFQFRGTRRISSFNLIIFPANGRRASNRCEELENAYNCLKNH